MRGSIDVGMVLSVNHFTCNDCFPYIPMGTVAVVNVVKNGPHLMDVIRVFDIYVRVKR